MKKLIAILAVALTTGAFASDSYLYWMLGSSVSMTDAKASQTTANYTSYAYARVGMVDSSGANQGYLSLYGNNGTGSDGITLLSRNADANVTSYAKLSANAATSGYSYYIELLNDQGAFVGRSSETLDYAGLSSYITSFGVSTPASAAWSPSSFTTAAIPEPTSGLLLLLGLAGLALKRKRA
jgi:hypothetical protein